MHLEDGTLTESANDHSSHAVQLSLDELKTETAPGQFLDPNGYRGLQAFHKYWGKKPSEPLRYLIERLCPPEGLICDPFLGYGTTAIAALELGRRVIGIDINPVATRIARLMIAPPTFSAVQRSLNFLERKIAEKILKSYATESGELATHYIWRGNKMERVWSHTGRKKADLAPTDFDFALAESYKTYSPNRIRPLRFFTNSRINSSATLTMRDLFQGRALRNIELILEAIDQLPTEDQEAMRLSLTATVGQMSNMVFAITERGKTSGVPTKCMQVGSWVIGYWRPELHFEVNVWNCFERRVNKLIKALCEKQSTASRKPRAGTFQTVEARLADYTITTGDSLQLLSRISDESIDLLLTDPPHSDRIPYLELSELWNAVLGEEPPFINEVVISNAKERGKNAREYASAMSRFLTTAEQKLCRHGSLVIFYNARSKAGWRFFSGFSNQGKEGQLQYLGCFPLIYSASSVVQDNRRGALRGDFGLVFSRSMKPMVAVQSIPGWTTDSPIPEC
jgi:hypothetical protein